MRDYKTPTRPAKGEILASAITLAVTWATLLAFLIF